MKASFLGLALVFTSGQVLAQVGELYDAVISENTSISDPAVAVKAAEGQWLAFSLPVLDGTRSPCCWKGKWSNLGEAGCSLKSKHESYGTRSDAPLAENVIVYGEIRDGQARRLRIVGEHCPVEGKGAQVNWIGGVDHGAGLDWLEAVARSGASNPNGDSASGDALYALALHRGAEAGQRLYSIAREGDGDLSGEAIFWLGEARGEPGFELLEQLLAELSPGERRREINFALAQNDSPEAVELLFDISKSDSDPEGPWGQGPMGSGLAFSPMRYLSPE